MATQPHSTSAPQAQTPQPTPIRAQLYWRDLSHVELTVLQAMLDMGDSTGNFLYPSVPRIALYTGLSRRAVQNALHGDARSCKGCHCPRPDPAKHTRPWNHRNSLCGRLALQELAPANATTRKAATYRLHPDGLPIKEKLVRAAIRRHWKVPPEVIAACPEELRSQMQTTLQFPPSDKESLAWVRTHREQWQRIQRELRTFSEARVTHARWTPHVAEQFVEAKCLEHGAPVDVALALAKIAAGTK